MKREDLKVCDKCGWYEHSKFDVPTVCRPDRGAMVDRLTQRISVPATKLGYETGYFAVKFEDEFTLRMRANTTGDQFRVDKLFLLRSLSHDDAVDLIETLKRWNDRCDRRANPGQPVRK